MIFTCKSINTGVYLFSVIPQFLLSVNETSFEARLAPVSCTVEYRQLYTEHTELFSLIYPFDLLLKLPQVLFENRASLGFMNNLSFPLFLSFSILASKAREKVDSKKQDINL